VAQEAVQAGDIKNYTRTKIAETLHDLPPWGRRNMKSEEVSSDFDPNDGEYVEGLVSTGVPALAIGVLSVIFFFFRMILKGICGCCYLVGCRKRKAPNQEAPGVEMEDKKGGLWLFNPKPKCLLFVFGFSALTVMGGVAFGFFQNKLVSEGLMDVFNAIKSMDDTTDENIGELEDLQGIMRALNSTASTFDNDVTNDCDGGDCSDSCSNQACTDAVNGFSTALAQIGTFMGDGVSGIQTGMDLYADVKVGDETEDAEKFDGYRERGQLAVMVLLLLPFVFVFISMACCKCFQSNCMIRVIVISSVFIGFLGWVITSVETVAVVGIADLCYEPSEFLVKQAADLGHENKDIVDFYVLCNTSSSSPLSGELDVATEELTNAYPEFDSFDTYLEMLESVGELTASEVSTHKATVETMRGQVNQTKAQIIGLGNTVFGCTATHNVYVDALNGICDKGLQGLAALVLIQGLESFCTFIAIYTILKFVAYTKAGKGPAFLRNSFSGFVYKDDEDDKGM